MIRIWCAALVGSLFFSLETASAHYLWLAIDENDGEHGTVNLYFEEGPRPGDGGYLDPFVRGGKTWIRTPDRDKPTPLELGEVKKPGKRWMAGALPVAGPRSIESYGKFGVYSYGDTEVLLHYYARYLDVTSAEQLRSLRRARQLALDIVARWVDGELKARVLWKGEPAAGRSVIVRGPGVNEKLRSDEKGTIEFKPTTRGRYTLRTSVDEPDRKGTDDGKKYDLTRHHSTLTIQLPIGRSVPAKASKTSADSKEWPQFLGPRRNGTSAETGLLDSWPSGGPREVWRVRGGVGMSGLAIRDGLLVTMVQRDGKQLVVALDAKNGGDVWSAEVSRAYENDMGNGPRATPTITDDLIYAFSGEGVLAALQMKDGSPRWRREVLKELKGKPADYGMACSPLVVANLVIVTAGAREATVAAYDRQSGKLAWKAGSDSTGYSSPALLHVGGRSQVVAFTGSSAIGIAPASGELLWRYPYKTDFDCNIATPLEYKGNVFISSGENHGSALLAIEPVGESFRVKEVWTSFGPRSVLRSEWQTSILLDGHLYGFDNVGSASAVSHFNCVAIATGERVWQQLRFGKGNLIAADGKLFMASFKGELVVARASPKGYEEIGRKKVLRQTRQAPALADGLLYMRDGREIVCLDVRKN